MKKNNPKLIKKKLKRSQSYGYGHNFNLRKKSLANLDTKIKSSFSNLNDILNRINDSKEEVLYNKFQFIDLKSLENLDNNILLLCNNLRNEAKYASKLSYGYNLGSLELDNFLSNLEKKHKKKLILIAKNLQKFEKKDDNSEISDKSSKKSERSNIKTEPVRNAEVQIFKNSNDLLVEGITNRKGIMKYLVDKNSNNLTIKVNKHGYFRAERFFKKNINMKENENGNYTCVMTFILVKKEILDKYNKVLFVLYTNMSKKIFNLSLQKYDDKEDDDFCHYYIKDMQKQNGILLTSLYYNQKKREDDEIILEENLNDDKKIEEQEKKEIKEKFKR